jgi:hypothetical protein
VFRDAVIAEGERKYNGSAEEIRYLPSNGVSHDVLVQLSEGGPETWRIVDLTVTVLFDARGMNAVDRRQPVSYIAVSEDSADTSSAPSATSLFFSRRPIMNDAA